MLCVLTAPGTSGLVCSGVGCGSVRSTVEREDVAADNRQTHECQMQRRVKRSFANASRSLIGAGIFVLNETGRPKRT